MELIADIFLISGAIAATVYCVVLSRRLRRFTDLENGVGGAIALLSSQVDDMTTTLKTAQTSAAGSARSLDELTGKAEGVAQRLELLVASMHDIPTGEEPNTPSLEPRSAPTEKSPVDETADDVGPVFLSSRQRA